MRKSFLISKIKPIKDNIVTETKPISQNASKTPIPINLSIIKGMYNEKILIEFEKSKSLLTEELNILTQSVEKYFSEDELEIEKNKNKLTKLQKRLEEISKTDEKNNNIEKVLLNRKIEEQNKQIANLEISLNTKIEQNKSQLSSKIDNSMKIITNKLEILQTKINVQTEINNKIKEAENKKIQEMILLEEKNNEIIRKLQEKKDNAVIPFKIFQTWYTSILSKPMKDATLKLKKNNPEFEYIFHDDSQCREFIANHFPDMVLYAFDNFIPGPYKADIWRYCVLYIHGGIYLNINFEPVDDFKLLNFVDEEYFVLDKNLNDTNKISIYNGLMAMKPKNEILKLALNQIIKTSVTKNYSISPLHVSGSGLLGSLLHKDSEEYSDVYDNYKLKLSKCGNYIVDNQDGSNLLKSYNTYRQEQLKNQKILHHDFLWNAKKIYVVKNMNNCVLINSIN